MEDFRNLIAPYASVIIDIGTGDGRFVYEGARRDGAKFFIGIDPNLPPLRKVSEKIYRRPAKGGAPNALFLQAAVEDLPDELNGIANQLHIQFPWGSLLGAVLRGDESVLAGLRRISAHGARLEVILGLDPERDQSEIARLGLPEISPAYLKNELRRRYLRAGFDIKNSEFISGSAAQELNSSWAKRLSSNPARMLVRISARAAP